MTRLARSGWTAFFLVMVGAIYLTCAPEAYAGRAAAESVVRQFLVRVGLIDATDTPIAQPTTSDIATVLGNGSDAASEGIENLGTLTFGAGAAVDDDLAVTGDAAVTGTVTVGGDVGITSGGAGVLAVVDATGAEANVDVNDIQIKPTGGNPSHAEGQVFYDATDKALAYHNDEADVTMQIGQEEWFRARNQSGSTITNGQVVYVSGATGGLPRITLARADAAATSCAIGVATHDIENNSNGYVTISGLVRDVDTSGTNEGDPIYLSPSVAGDFTTTIPTSPDRIVPLGHVMTVNPSNGVIHVQIEAQSLFGLADLSVPFVTDKKLIEDPELTYNGTTDTLTVGSLSLATDLPITQGGTGASDAATARTNLGLGDLAVESSPLTADKGGTGLTSYGTFDLLYADSPTSLASLPVGPAGQVLTVTTGGSLAWEAAAAGGTEGIQDTLQAGSDAGSEGLENLGTLTFGSGAVVDGDATVTGTLSAENASITDTVTTGTISATTYVGAPAATLAATMTTGNTTPGGGTNLEISSGDIITSAAGAGLNITAASGQNIDLKAGNNGGEARLEGADGTGGQNGGAVWVVGGDALDTGGDGGPAYLSSGGGFGGDPDGDVLLQIDEVTIITLNDDGTLTWSSDGTHDVGSASTGRPRDLYLGGFAVMRRQVISKSSSDTLSDDDSWSLVDNQGAGAVQITLTLPAITRGTTFTFATVDAGTIAVDPPAGTAVSYSGGIMGDSEDLLLAPSGSSVTLTASGTLWVSTSEVGSLIEASP